MVTLFVAYSLSKNSLLGTDAENNPIQKRPKPESGPVIPSITSSTYQALDIFHIRFHIRFRSHFHSLPCHICIWCLGGFIFFHNRL